jgi:hypothetical protein
MDKRANKRTNFYHDASGYYSSTNGNRTEYADHSEYLNALADYLKSIAIPDILDILDAIPHINRLSAGAYNLLGAEFDPDNFTDSDGTTNPTTHGN